MTDSIPDSLRTRHLKTASQLKSTTRTAAGSSPTDAPWATPADGTLHFMPREMVLELEPPLDPTGKDISQVGAQQLYYILDYYILAEQGVVTEACRLINSKQFPVELSEDAKAGARAIEKQELEHSRGFGRLRDWLERHFHEQVADYEPAFASSLDELLDKVGCREIATVVFAAITEVYPPTLAPLLRNDTSIQALVRDLFLAHEDEEILHRAYWWELIAELWKAMSPAHRTELGPLLPSMLACHLARDASGDRLILQNALASGAARLRANASVGSGTKNSIGRVADGLVQRGILGGTERDGFVEAALKAIQ